MRWVIHQLNVNNAVVTAIATVAIGIVALLQWHALDNTDRTLGAQNQIQKRIMEPDSRAKLIALQISLPLEADKPLSGSVIILNGGHTQATITYDRIAVVVGQHLPTRFPANYDDRIYTDKDDNSGRPNHHLAGDDREWKFSVSSPILTSRSIQQIKAGKNFELWVLGLIRYDDVSGTPRLTIFCREYDPGSGRFKPSNDGEYEYSN